LSPKPHVSHSTAGVLANGWPHSTHSLAFVPNPQVLQSKAAVLMAAYSLEWLPSIAGEFRSTKTGWWKVK
jgi:hypothetical protein